jgi:hypothetical protein
LLICVLRLQILAPLTPQVKFTFITDCCHSGSMTDQPLQQISGDKDPNAPEGVDEGDDRELLGSFFKGEEGVRCSLSSYE